MIIQRRDVTSAPPPPLPPRVQPSAPPPPDTEEAHRRLVYPQQEPFFNHHSYYPHNSSSQCIMPPGSSGLTPDLSISFPNLSLPQFSPVLERRHQLVHFPSINELSNGHTPYLYHHYQQVQQSRPITSHIVEELNSSGVVLRDKIKVQTFSDLQNNEIQQNREVMVCSPKSFRPPKPSPRSRRSGQNVDGFPRSTDIEEEGNQHINRVSVHCLITS